jgi:hypothetical protein
MGRGAHLASRAVPPTSPHPLPCWPSRGQVRLGAGVNGQLRPLRRGGGDPGRCGLSLSFGSGPMAPRPVSTRSPACPLTSA